MPSSAQPRLSGGSSTNAGRRSQPAPAARPSATPRHSAGRSLRDRAEDLPSGLPHPRPSGGGAAPPRYTSDEIEAAARDAQRQLASRQPALALKRERRSQLFPAPEEALPTDPSQSRSPDSVVSPSAAAAEGTPSPAPARESSAPRGSFSMPRSASSAPSSAPSVPRAPSAGAEPGNSSGSRSDAPHTQSGGGGGVLSGLASALGKLVPHKTADSAAPAPELTPAETKRQRQREELLLKTKETLTRSGLFNTRSDAFPVVCPIAESHACDFILQFGTQAAIDEHLAPAVYHLINKITLTRAELGGAALNTDKGGGGGADDAVRVFLAEVVPLAAGRVAVHVVLRPKLRDAAVAHYARAFNAELAPSLVGGIPFPSRAQEAQHHALVAALPDPAPDPPSSSPSSPSPDSYAPSVQCRVLHRLLAAELERGARVPVTSAPLEHLALYPAHADDQRDAVYDTQVLGRRAPRSSSSSPSLPRGGGGALAVLAAARRAVLGDVDEDCIRDYFGEETMFYFAWMNLYKRALLVLSVSLLACAAAGALSDRAASEGEAGSPLVRLLMGGGAADSPAQLRAFTVLAATLMALGGVALAKAFSRRVSALCLRHQLYQTADGVPGAAATGVEPNPGFRGTPRRDPATGEVELYYSPALRRFVRQPLAWAAIAAFIGVTLAATVVSLNLGGLIPRRDSLGAIPALYDLAQPGGVFCRETAGLLSALPGAAHGLVIALLSAAFKVLSRRAAAFENHRYRRDYQRSLTQKRVCFEFANSYGKLLYVALVRQSWAELAYNMRSIFLTGVFVRLFGGTILPFALTHAPKYLGGGSRRAEGRLQGPHSARLLRHEDPSILTTHYRCHPELAGAAPHAGGADSALDQYDESLDEGELYSDFAEMIIQFGYLAFFSLAFPLAVAVALLSNLIEVRSDLFKMCYAVRRPLPRYGATAALTWAGILRATAAAALVVNSFLLSLIWVNPGGRAGDSAPSSSAAPLTGLEVAFHSRAAAARAGREADAALARVFLLAAAAEHTLVPLGALLWWWVPDQSWRVAAYLRRAALTRK